MPQFIEALNTNLQLYKSRFGEPPVPPVQQQPNARRPTPQEIYDDLKLPDDVLSGVYANGVMIGHGASEFGLDFLTSFFPQSAVSARVFLAAGQVPRLLESLRSAVRQLEQRHQAAQGGVPPLPPAGGDPQSPPASDNPGPGNQAPGNQAPGDQAPGDQAPGDEAPGGDRLDPPSDDASNDDPPAPI
jgi:hypothetical protein